MEIKKIIDKIETGQQLSKIYSYTLDGEAVWSSVAIQKWENSYKVFIDEILENNMGSEEYLKEIKIKFNTPEFREDKTIEYAQKVKMIEYSKICAQI